MFIIYSPPNLYKMKKLLLPSITLLVSISILVGFSSKKKTIHPGTAASNAINCVAPLNITAITDAEFNARYNPNVVMVRKNVYALSAAEITSIKTGVTAMKALPYTNKTSWEYQAAIHGTTRPDNLPSWNTCHQAGASFFFLAWHRMYVYFFERILRAKSGNANLTLPYWNYQTNAVIPPDWRNSAASNPLYDGSRSSTLNGGGSLPASIMTSINNALDLVPYYDFQTSLNGPHGSVHTTINGNMKNTNTAAKDPVFWLHHCNIDRLWAVWLRKCGGRANPTDAPWLTKTYTFFDENGTAVNMNGSQVIKTATQLNYNYDFSLIINPCLVIANKWVSTQRTFLLRKVAPLVLDGRLNRTSFKAEKPDELDNFMRTTKKSRINFSSATAPEKLVISLGGIKIDKMPEGVIEVYINLPAGETPTSASKSFVGLLDLFEAEHHQNMKGMGEPDDIEMDASKAAQALGLTLAGLKNAEISLVVRGNSLRGAEVKTEAKVTIQRTNFSILQLNK
jgi:Common central domain of tyrosinase/Polyphenol oxidase middle domain